MAEEKCIVCGEKAAGWVESMPFCMVCCRADPKLLIEAAKKIANERVKKKIQEYEKR